MPGINYYWMQHADALQREFTYSDMGTLSIVSILVIVFAGVIAYALYRILEKIL